MPETLAICPGSFDPPTMGHVDIINRGLRLFDRVIVAVTFNVGALFSVEERIDMLRDCFPGQPRVAFDSLDGLLAAYAKQRGAQAIVRGLRAPSDFEYELQMSQMNRHLVPDLETVFLSTEPVGSYVSSSLVKEVASLGGDVSALVPPHVGVALNARFPKV